MNINLTLFGQIITFGIFVWFVAKYVWPPLMGVIEERKRAIADGLAAAEQGKADLAAASERKDELLRDARARAGELISEGEKRREQLVEAARGEAEAEKGRIVEDGRKQIAQERAGMAREMQDKLGELAVAGAAKILAREVDGKAHADIIDGLKREL